MALPDYILHCLDDIKYWPDVCKSLSQQLGLMNGSLDHPYNTPDGTDFSNLVDIFVEEMGQVDDHFVRRSLICSILTTLGNTLDDNIRSLANSLFSFPRLSHLCPSATRKGEGAVHGHAIHLSLVHFEGELIAEENYIANPTDSCTFCSVDPGGEPDIDENGQPSEDVPAWRALPHGAHMLLDYDNHDGMDFPLFVVAEATNIHNLMASSLYQRFVMSINDPLIGFEVCDSDCLMRICIGWFVVQEDESPILHIAHASKTPSSFGVYNLRDPLSMRNLVDLVLSLRSKAQGVPITLSPPHTLRRFCWKLEHATLINRPDDKEDNWLSRTQRWVEATITPMDGDGYSAKSCTSPTSSVENVSTEESENNSSSRRTSVSPDITRNHQGSHNLAKTQYTEENDPDPLNRTYAYLLEREAILLSCVPPNESFPDAQLIQEMIDSYQRFTGPCIIPEWTSDNTAPLKHCSEALKGICGDLIKEHQDSLTGTTPLPELDASLVPLLEKKVDILLQPSLYAARMPPESFDQPSPSSFRHMWDPFFISFCRQGPAANGMELCFDSRVRTSRNRLADMVQAASKREKGALPVSDVKGYMKTLSGQIYRRSASELLHGLKPILRTAMRVTFENHDMICNQQNTEDGIFYEMVLERAQGEPRNGICDLVLLQPAVFESHRSSPGRVLCPPSCTFVVSENRPVGLPTLHQAPSTRNKTTTPQMEYCTRAFDDYQLHWGRRNHDHVAVTAQPNSVSQAGPPRPLMLPVILVNYIEAGEDYWSSSHRLSVHLVSAVDHYAHLGIKEYPVWGINIGTSFASILMAWRSSATNHTYVLQRLTKLYGIDKPLDALYFAAFLLRVQKHQPRLQCSDFILSHLDENASGTDSEHAEPSHVVLTVDPNCDDPEGEWSQWARDSQHLDVS